jgi:hypothetical protein
MLIWKVLVSWDLHWRISLHKFILIESWFIAMIRLCAILVFVTETWMMPWFPLIYGIESWKPFMALTLFQCVGLCTYKWWVEYLQLSRVFTLALNVMPSIVTMQGLSEFENGLGDGWSYVNGLTYKYSYWFACWNGAWFTTPKKVQRSMGDR